jgi:hypothetical protein
VCDCLWLGQGLNRILQIKLLFDNSIPTIFVGVSACV